MQQADPLIRTKLRLPLTRPGLVLRPHLQDFATRLLSQLKFEPKAALAAKNMTASASLAAPLSQHKEVLDHMVLGCTNQAIARQLIVTPGTIKAYTASVYRKLDVANRTEAVSRARQFGLLP